MKIDLDDDNVRLIKVSRIQVREFFDEDECPFSEEFETALDYAQGDVTEKGVQYIIIKIS